jgi:hypothetical protein
MRVKSACDLLCVRDKGFAFFDFFTPDWGKTTVKSS